MKRENTALVIGVIIVVAFAIQHVSASPGFEVNSVLLKVTIHQGEVTTRTIGFTTSDGGEVYLESSVKGVILSDRQFVVNAGESKSVTVFFNGTSLTPGVYVGTIQMRNNKESSSIPVIFEVESKDVFFDSNLDIPPQYLQIYPGERLLAQLKIFDLVSGGTSNGMGPTKIQVDYQVHSLDGNVLSSESENVVVDMQTQYTKTMSFPLDTKPGTYVFSITAKHQSSVGTATQMFSVAKKENSLFSGDSGLIDLKFFAILGSIVLFFIILILFFVYLMKDRDKLLVELRDYHTDELQKQKELLLEQQRILKKKGLVKPVEVEKEVKEKLKKLKVKQKKRELEFKKLKEDGDIESMKKKLQEWRQAGYNTLALEYKLRGLNESEMSALMDSWKKKYSTEGYKNKK